MGKCSPVPTGRENNSDSVSSGERKRMRPNRAGWDSCQALHVRGCGTSCRASDRLVGRRNLRHSQKSIEWLGM